MTPSEELALIMKKQEKIVAKYAKRLLRELVKKAPVDTGTFKSAWSIESKGDMEWRISNNMEYASVLFDGRHLVGNKWYGSDQWPEGGHGLLEQINNELEKELKAI